MKLKFDWCHTPAGSLAFCTSDVLDSSGISPLCCLLMDDGVSIGKLLRVGWRKGYLVLTGSFQQKHAKVFFGLGSVGVLNLAKLKQRYIRYSKIVFRKKLILWNSGM